MDCYVRQRALCGGSLGPLENLGWAFAHPRPPPQMAPLDYLLGFTKISLLAKYMGQRVSQLHRLSNKTSPPVPAPPWT